MHRIKSPTCVYLRSRSSYRVLPLGLFCVCACWLCDHDQSDPQVVTLLLRSATMGHSAAGLPPSAAPQAPPYPPCVSSWDLLLHYYRLVELSSGSDWFLAEDRVVGGEADRTEATLWWHGLGQKDRLGWHQDCSSLIPRSSPLLSTRGNHLEEVKQNTGLTNLTPNPPFTPLHTHSREKADLKACVSQHSVKNMADFRNNESFCINSPLCVSDFLPSVHQFILWRLGSPRTTETTCSS